MTIHACNPCVKHNVAAGVHERPHIHTERPVSGVVEIGETESVSHFVDDRTYTVLSIKEQFACTAVRTEYHCLVVISYSQRCGTFFWPDSVGIIDRVLTITGIDEEYKTDFSVVLVVKFRPIYGIVFYCQFACFGV